MKDKLLSIAKKTGIKKSELSSLWRIEIIGLLIFSLFGVISCKQVKPSKPTVLPQQQTKPIQPSVPEEKIPPSVEYQTEQQQTEPIQPSSIEEPREPWNGYPAGTRYGTVSIIDILC